MVRELMKDTVFLAQKAQPATADDIPTADDLLDTLRAHADGCVGMAANMIGVNKAIIVFDDEGHPAGDVQPRNRLPQGPLSYRGRLPLPAGPAQDQAPQNHQGAVAGPRNAHSHQKLHRLDRPDHPARSRPL